MKNDGTPCRQFEPLSVGGHDRKKEKIAASSETGRKKEKRRGRSEKERD